MPKSRLSETIGVRRVVVGGRSKSEAWIVRGSSCKYVLIGVFIIVGCFVAAIVATQITFVSEKHKLVAEEKAHQTMEVVLEKRFLEVGSLLENELRRQLKHTKTAEAVHATVQATLESIDYPGQTVFPGDAAYDDLVQTVNGMAGEVSRIMNSYAEQMSAEATRSQKLLSVIAQHLGGSETDELAADTALKPFEEKQSRDELIALKERRAKQDLAEHSGRGGKSKLHDRAKEARQRVERSSSGHVVPNEDSEQDTPDSSDNAFEARREAIRANLEAKGKERAAMMRKVG